MKIKITSFFLVGIFLSLLFTKNAVASTLQWSSRTSMPTPRSSLGAAATSNGKIYAIGGLESYSGIVTGTIEEYDITTNTWTVKTPMSTPRFSMGVVLGSNNKIYAIGGNNGSGSTNTVEQYDPVTDAWATKTNMPTSRMDVEVVSTLNGKIYAIGGCCDVNGSYLDSVEEYDIYTDTWSTKANVPTPTSAGRGGVYANNGKIYIFGPPNSGAVQVFDPDADIWTITATMISKRWYMGNTLGPDGKIYTIGGYQDLRPTNSFYGAVDNVEDYDPIMDTWHINTPLPTKRYNLAAVTGSNGKLYAIGGDSYDSSVGTGQVLAIVEEATITSTTPTPTLTPTPTPPQLNALNPANIWVGVKNKKDVGLSFDLLAEVYKNGVILVSSGQLNSVPGGAQGFAHAILNSISFDPFSPADFPEGSTITIKLSVRNACTGSALNSGTARLWFNDTFADSHFSATIGTTSSDYYLLNGSALGISFGPGPITIADVSVGAPCGSFKPFGTWAITPSAY